MITASRVQIAVALEAEATAQAAFDTACPGVFDVTSPDRTLWADAATPTIPAWAVGQGDLAQVDYALLATLALAAGINHLAIGAWIDTDPPTYQPAEQAGTLWVALDIVPLEVE